MDSVKVTLARDLLKNKKYSEALQVANELLAEDLSNLEALWIISTCYFELGDDVSTERNLRNYLKFDSNNVDGIHRLVLCIKRQGRIQEAIDYLRKGIERIEDPLLCSELAGLYLEQGDSDLAIFHANAALQLEPDNHHAQMVLGSVFILLGTPKEAIKHLLSAQQQAPSNPQVYINLAAAYGLLNDGLNQIESLNLALRCDNSLHGLYLLIGDLCLQQQDADQALEAFSKYLLFDDKSVDAHLGLARAQRMSGENDLSKQTYLNVVREHPEHIVAWHELGKLFEITDEIEKASKCFERVLELDVDNDPAKEFFQANSNNCS